VVKYLPPLNVLTDVQSVERQGLNMRASRGMGAINPSKMPTGKKKARRTILTSHNMLKVVR
jgi:hypothetical protein